MSRKPETVSRAFRAAWPEMAEIAKQNDIRVGNHGGAFWAGDYQLTGFTTIITDGQPRPALRVDVEKRIREIFAAIVAGRATNAAMTPRERFARAMHGLTTIKPRPNMISSWGDPGGDTAAMCGWRGFPDDYRITLAGLGEVARADAPTIDDAIPLLRAAFEKWEGTAP